MTPRTPLAVVSAALSAGAVFVVLDTAAPDRRVAAAVASGLTVGVTMGVGLLAGHARADGRFGQLLLAIGAAASLTALAHAQDSTLYSVGRVAVWLVVPASLYLMLAFPSGRVTHPADRRIVAGVAALVGVLYLPTALIAPEFPSPMPWTSCGADCPPNAFDVVHVDPAVVDAIRIVREVLALVAVSAVAVALALRARRSSGLLRAALLPVVAVAAFQAVVFPAYQWMRVSGHVSSVVDLIGWAWIFTTPAIALSFAGGLLQRRLQVASVIQRLTWELRPPADADRLRDSLAVALEDPELRVVYWLSGDPGRWVDESGRPVAAPGHEDGRVSTEVVMEGRLVAAVVHDAALAPDPELVRAAASYGLVVLENTRLIEELRGSLQRLSESEHQRMTAEARERKRIEQDLHDGAQQRLVALRINLGLLGEHLADEAPGRVAELERVATHVDATIEDMRRIAHALSPPLLAEAGLAVALRTAARGAPLDVVVRADGVGRLGEGVEKTVYFACMEAIQNAAKHARGATAVTVDIVVDDAVRFEVSDDGAGFDMGQSNGGGLPSMVRRDGSALPNAAPGDGNGWPNAAQGDGNGWPNAAQGDDNGWPNAAQSDGSGLPNMASRLASLGGQLVIHSTPGQGTTIVGRVPLQRGKVVSSAP
jgi:signal transduction histidine kinase